MARFFVNAPPNGRKMVRLAGADLHHMRNVLRLKKGDVVQIIDPSGTEYEAVIIEIGRREAKIEVVKELEMLPEKTSGTIVEIAQALPKGDKMDWIVQKCTELGASSIRPFLSARSIPRPNKVATDRKIERWRKIALEAAKQCGRTDVPRIGNLSDFNEILKLPEEGFTRIVLHERAEKTWDRIFSQDQKGFFVMIGPEGGFTKDEIELCIRNGFIPTGLGKRILRTETASVAILSILQFARGDMG